MATRFYLPSTGTAVVSPAYDVAWDNTTFAARLATVTTPSLTAMTTVADNVNIKLDEDHLYRQYVSDPISSQTIVSGTVTFQIRAAESNTAANLFSSISIRVVSNDGSTFRSPDLLSLSRDDTEWAAALTNRSFTGITGEVDAQANDRIVIEIGQGGDPTGGGNHNDGTMRIGDNGGSDLPEDDTDTNDYNPWVEFSTTISFPVAPSSITVDTLTLAGSSQSLGDVTPGAISQLLDELTLIGSPENFTPSPGAISQALNALHLTSTLGIWGLDFDPNPRGFFNAGRGGNLDDLPTGGPFTVDFWARLDNHDALRWIVSKEAGGGATGWNIYVDDSGRLTSYIYTDGSDGRNWTGAGTFNEDSVWRHATLYYDDGGDRMPYLAITGSWQGSQAASSGNYDSDVNDDFIVGARGQGLGGPWDGAISMLRISNGDRYGYLSNFTDFPSRDQIVLPDGNTLYLWNFYDGEGNVSEEIEEQTGIVSGSATWILDESPSIFPGSVSQLLDELTLASSPEGLSLSAGAVSLLMDVLTLVSSVEAISIDIVVSILLDALTLSSSLEDLGDITPGAVSTLLDVLTLVSSLESLNVSAGSISQLLNTLTLISSLESSSVSPGIVSQLLDELTLASSLESLNISAGAISQLLDTLTLSSSVEQISVSAGILILLNALTLASSLESLNVTPGIVSLLLDTLTLISSTENIDILAGIQIVLSALVLASSLESLNVVPGTMSVVLSALVLSGAVDTISISEGILSITLNTLSLASSLETSTITPGTISIVLDELTLTGAADSVTLVPGGVSILIDTVTLTSSAEPITINISYRIILQTLSLASAAEDITEVPGTISIPVDTLTLESTIEDVIISMVVAMLGGQVNISDTLISDIIAATSDIGDIIITDGEG